MVRSTSRTWCPVLIAVAILLLGQAPSLVSQVTSGILVSANPQESTVHATLWVRTAAEYQALCRQTYRHALDRVRVKQNLLAEQGQPSKPSAVVLDLDETVLDNSAFQSSLILKKEKFSEPVFDAFVREKTQLVKLVPGAKEFLDGVEQLGVTVFYISNRPDSERAATIEVLTRLQLNVKALEGRLLLKQESSDKSERRRKVAESHEILALIGDNLADLSEEFGYKAFAKSPDPVAARADAVQQKAARFGDDWFVLPNPVYGDWTRLLDWQHPEKYLQD